MEIESDYLNIVETVTQNHGVTRAQIEGRDRCNHAVFARRIVAICMREKGYSLPEIGEMIGRNHTSVLRLVKTELNQAGARKRRSMALAEAARMADGVVRAKQPKPQVSRWEAAPRCRLEAQWRRAVEAFETAPAFERQATWVAQMRIVFPHSWQAQAMMPPRASHAL